MLLSARLARISILSCFFLFFLVILRKFLIIPLVKVKTRVKLALAIPAGTATMLVKEIIDIPQLVADKTIKILSM